jgi:hypothetical protein
MARKGLCLLLGAALLFAAAPRLGATSDEDHEKKVLTLLAVQKALQEGRDALKRGDYQAAVTVLEARVAYIDGSKEYLDALRDAYLGYIRELKQGNRAADIPTYMRRLECCDPGALLEINAPRPTPAAVKPSAPPAAPAKTAETAVAASPGDGGAGKRAGEARALLDQAEKEFDARHYADAGKLYERCNQADAAVAGEGRERWAYCKMFAVVDAFNHAPAGAPAPAEWERDVKQALTLAPDNKALGVFGKGLLDKIQGQRGPLARAAASDRPEDLQADVELRHTPRQQGQQWAVCETANFRIFHNQKPEVAERAGRIAEATRVTAAKKWFGEALPAWEARCDVYLHATAQDYSLATHQPPQLAGHSSFGNQGERVVSRRIDLHCDDANVFIGVLPHEATHVVLAGHFGRMLPHWADEGMAVLSEPRERIDLHLHNLPQHRADGEVFALAELMQMDNYPDGKRIGAFYAESVSLVEFLSKEKGHPVFAQFMRDGMAGGYEAALQKYYGIHGFDELQQRWQRYAFGGVAERGP